MKKPNLFARLGQSDTLTKQPIIELFGTSRVLIENHMGILAYCVNEIQIKLSYGKVSVTGNCLQVQQISNDQLVITGEINGLSVCRR